MRSTFILIGVLAAILLLSLGTVSADPEVVENQHGVHDNFNTLRYADPANFINNPSLLSDYWFIGLNTAIPPARSINQTCAGFGNNGSNGNPTANCAYIVPSDDGGALHMEVQPDPNGLFWWVQVSDVLDSSIFAFNGYDANGFPTAVQTRNLRWFPEPGHQITLQSRVRFSPNYNAAATAGAAGTAGMGFWNMPTYFLPEPPCPVCLPFASAAVHAFWFTYTEAGSLGGNFVGYTGNVYDQDFPAIEQPDHTISFTGVNMSDWFVQRIVWSADMAGNQSITFAVEQGTYYAEWTFQLARPLPPLSLEYWVDSSRITTTEEGTAIPGVAPILETQWMEVDFIHVVETGPQ